MYIHTSEQDGANTGPRKVEDQRSKHLQIVACRHLYKAAIGETARAAVAFGPLLLRRKSARLDDGAAEVLCCWWWWCRLGFRSPAAPLLGSPIRDGTPPLLAAYLRAPLASSSRETLPSIHMESAGLRHTGHPPSRSTVAHRLKPSNQCGRPLGLGEGGGAWLLDDSEQARPGRRDDKI